MPASFILQRLVSNRLRAKNAEQALAGGPLTDEAIAAKAMAICDPAKDLRGDRKYKIEMAGPMVRRALARAATGAANRSTETDA